MTNHKTDLGPGKAQTEGRRNKVMIEEGRERLGRRRERERERAMQ